MKRLIVILCVLAAVVLAMAFSRPNPTLHRDKVKEAVNAYIEYKAKTKDGEKMIYDVLGMNMNNSRVIVNGLSLFLLGKNGMTVKSYLVCNVGFVKIGKEEIPVSLGVCKHVFTLSEKDIDKIVNKYHKWSAAE